MKRIFAVICLAFCLTITATAQALEERPLSDAPPPATTATPAAQVTPVQGQPAAQPAGQAAPVAPSDGQTGQPPALSPAGTAAQDQPQPVAETPPPPPADPSKPGKQRKYSREEVHREVMGFFDSGSAGLAELVSKAFKDLGQPTGYIKGSEAGGALVVGLRYGTGYLYLKNHKPIEVFWQSPSVGLDIGVNAVRVFTLVYGMERPEEIFHRYPGVDGSAYLIGGFGMTYQRSENITLAPIRFGVGLRLGANVGYQHYTRTQEINPF
ncbi:DUF1134 domain-containing protein [Desulfolutivibrio sulfoxidireducens]|uniref:DUF1134 domain-containing protein n=1 Tax=Desulfolutivibrio sulfoxidireducens TaxID=2773299 RepID=UPI00159D834A|nr:DUF1134 domain-containing protein [Desulfolutivibrio sulfoxidireducens]QLA14734.1 DUF1134 domain-containing protein [Desulfolutivibrio sulfoxidireducens]QLA18315.1 DUF1134 domain-containing protein [Desulfolutivibrio sulfoxidireducens]